MGGSLGEAPSGGAGGPATRPAGAGLAWATWGTRAVGRRCSAKPALVMRVPLRHPPPGFGGRLAWGRYPTSPRWWGQPGRRLGSAASGPWAPRGVGRARRGQTSPGCVGSPWVPFGAFRLCQPPPGALPGAWGGAIGVDPTGQSTFPTSPSHRRWERE